MRNEELIRAISKDCLLSESVVSDVLNSLKGIIVKELLDTGSAKIYGLVNVSTVKRERGYTTSLGEVMPGEYLSASISRPIRRLFRNFNSSTGKNHFVTPKNWQKFTKYLLEQENERGQATAGKGNPIAKVPTSDYDPVEELAESMLESDERDRPVVSYNNSEIVNPFLDD